MNTIVEVTMADIGKEERTIEVLPSTEPAPSREADPVPAQEPEQAPA